MPISRTYLAPVLGLAFAVSALALAPSVLSQDAVPPETVLATVDGQSITEADLGFAAEDMAQDLQQVPAQERRAFLLRVMIDMKVMAKAAKDAGMDQTSLFQQRLAYLEDRALRRAYFADTIAAAVTPEAVEALYNELVANYEPQDEIRARHILVGTEEEAEALKAEIEGGADFAALAVEHSLDPGSANGGDLGFFGRGMMVAPFEEAAFALAEIGEVSEPIQSQFGWHLIKLEERRQSSPPTLQQLEGQLQQQVLIDTFDDVVERLMDAAEVEILDPELAAAVEAQQALEQGAGQ